MSSFFSKIGEDVEDNILDDSIFHYKSYIENDTKITPEIKELAINVAKYDKPDIFKNIPSREVRETIAFSISICFEDKRVPSKEKTEELLEKLQKSKNK